MGDRAAHRASVACLEVPDVGHRQVQQRRLLGQPGPRQELGLGQGGANFEHAVLGTQVAQIGDTRDVDEQLGLNQAHVHHGPQRLAAGHDTRLLATLFQSIEGLLDGGSAQVVESLRLHCPTPRARSNRVHHDS